MNKLEILAILPYRELVSLVEKAVSRYTNIHVDCIVGNLEEGQAIDYALWMLPMKQQQYRISQYLSSMESNSPFMFAVFDSGKKLKHITFHSADMTTEEFVQYFSSNLPALEKDCGSQIYRQIGQNLYLLHVMSRKIDGEDHLFIYGQVFYEPVNLNSDAVLLKKDIEDTGYVFKNSYGVVNSIGYAREAIQNCCESPLPVLILGEEGTGKDAAAKSIFRRGSYSSNPFFIINCEIVSDREWYRFFNKSTSPLLYVNCTIFFKNIHRLTSQHAKNLRKLIEQSNLCQRNKVIFSAFVSSDGDKPEFARYILDEIQCILLQPLPIRKRKEDLKNMLVIYLNEMNIPYGKHIIGFTQEAEQAFLDFDWPGNITQLKRVLRELVIHTEGMYISGDMVEEYIRNEIFDSSENLTYNINLDQSLENITYDIVRIIMKQENMNQSRVAKRLGVGRTTIWRILKSRE